jgi:phospholipid/cholesterol/gamma-HCH transport system permease protein
MTEKPSGRGWSARVDSDGIIFSIVQEWTTQDSLSQSELAEPLLSREGIRAIAFDSSGLGYWDSSLLVFLSNLRGISVQRGVRFDEAGLPAAVRRLLAILPENRPAAAVTPRRGAIVERVGRSVIAQGSEAVAITTLFGNTILSSGAALRGRARMRGVDLMTCVQNAGVFALPIVAVVNLLVGGIIAFVGAVELRKFGADIYIANLVGVAMFRELGAIMTAIVMSGRTGGAYAAEIATMQGSEEIDALRVIGIPVQDYLILPRVAALTAMMPLLYLYGSVVGVLGGFAVAITMLHISPETFIVQTRAAVTVGEVVFGLIKSIAFGALISIAGCRIGLKAGRSTTDVGRAATHAVVVSIVGVIALDAVFAVCANALDF